MKFYTFFVEFLTFLQEIKVFRAGGRIAKNNWQHFFGLDAPPQLTRPPAISKDKLPVVCARSEHELSCSEKKTHYSTRIKDAGIAIRHSRGYTFFFTAGSTSGLEEVDNRGYTYKIIKASPQSSQNEFSQKFKLPKLVCRSPLAHFEAAPLPF